MDAATKGLTTGKGTMDKLAGAGGAIVSVMGKAAKAVGGLGILTAGLALKGGFSRAMAIEDAQASLRGLGHDTKSIERIMDSALASVKGTAFGLGDATTIAATAVAAGIKPGEELTRTLTLTANSAALARVGLDEMGSVLNKVWTAGRVGTEELNQLADRGIPIWTELAESYGVSAEELRKMVSEGKVDAETFAGVLENTVGDAALAMGDTTRGAWQNMMAALGRAGESFLKGVWPMFKGGMSAITDAIDAVAPKVEAFGAAFSDWLADVLPKVGKFISAMVGRLKPAFEAVASFVVDTLVPGLVDFGKWLIDHKPILIGIATAIGTFLVAAFTAWAIAATKAALATALALAPFVAIGAAIAAVTAAFVWAYQNVDWFRSAVDAVGRFLKNTLWPILRNVGGFLAGAFSDAWDGVSTAAKTLWESVFKPLWSWISGTAMPTLSNMANAYLGPLATAFSAVGTAAKWVWDNVLSPLGSWLKSTFSTVVSKVSGVWSALKGAIDAIAGFGSSIFNGVVDAIGKIIGPLERALGLLDAVKRRMESMAILGGSLVNDSDARRLAKQAGIKLPKFHSGGVVEGRPGEEVLAIVKAGETVLPTHNRTWTGNQASGRSDSGPRVQIGELHIGTREDLPAADWWARTTLAGI